MSASSESFLHWVKRHVGWMAETGERQYERGRMILVVGCEGGSIWCRHAWRTELGELDCGVFGEPSASAEPADAYVRDTDHHRFPAGAGGCECVAPSFCA